MPTRPTTLLNRALRLSAAPLLVSLLATCSGSTDPGATVAFATVSAGMSHTCGVTTTGRVYCWGRNQFGQLGDGTTDDSPVPTRVQTDFLFDLVSAGMHHTCGLAQGGAVFCWGANFNGEAGDGTQINRLAPVRTLGNHTFRTVNTGESHSCGITTANLGYCWGAPLGPAPDGTGSLPNALVPQPLNLGALASLSAGFEIACAATAHGALFCWGLKPPGIEPPEDTAFPLPVPGAPSLVAVSAGHKHACGTTADDRVYCWGRNTGGQLGDGTLTDRHAPMPVSGDTRFRQVSAESGGHTCALTGEGAAYCWGQSRFGELGDSTIGVQSAPVAVSGDLVFVSIGVGGWHTCGVTPSGLAYCWGYGVFGQLGTGGTEDSPVPARVTVPIP